jgi:DNA primase
MPAKWVDLRGVKAVASLEAVLRWYQVKDLHRSGPKDQLRGRCPLHGEGGEDAFHASLSKNAYHCFYCQAHGNVLDFVAGMEHCSVREAGLRLQDWLHSGQLGATGRPEKQLVPKEEGLNPLSFQLRDVDAAHPYLAHRGIERGTADRFGVGFYSGRGLMSKRIVIPIHDVQGRLVAYCGRSLDEALPRYRLPAGFRKSLVLFNLHRAASCGQTSAVIVEGFFDCMKVDQSGWKSVVALMGSSLSSEQERLLLGLFRRIILFLDGDAAGKAGTSAIMARLAARCDVQAIRLADGEQPDQLTEQQIQLHLKVVGRTS